MGDSGERVSIFRGGGAVAPAVLRAVRQGLRSIMHGACRRAAVQQGGRKARSALCQSDDGHATHFYHSN
jgi:hypothetical protein